MDGQFKKLSQILSTLLALGSIVVSILMLAGYSYNIGYLSGFGLSSDALAYSFYESVSTAFYLGIIVFAEIVKRLHWFYFWLGFVIIFPLLFLIAVFIFRKYFNGEKIRVWAEKQKSKDRVSNKVFFLFLDMYEFIHKGNTVFTAIYLAIVLTPFLIVYIPLQKGLDDSKDQKQKFEAAEFSCSKLPQQQLACTRLREKQTGKILTEGLLVAGTASSIAIFDGEKHHVFGRSTDYSIEIEPAIAE